VRERVSYVARAQQALSPLKWERERERDDQDWIIRPFGGSVSGPKFSDSDGDFFFRENAQHQPETETEAKDSIFLDTSTAYTLWQWTGHRRLWTIEHKLDCQPIETRRIRLNSFQSIRKARTDFDGADRAADFF
jgi:hypothetical protein